MSNIKHFFIDVIETEEEYFRDVLRCLLHTILFHRTLGTVQPKEVIIELLDLYYVQSDNEELIKKVEEHVEALSKSLVKNGKDLLQIDVIFHEKVFVTSWWGRKKEEIVPWEHWGLKIKLLRPNTHSQERRVALSKQLTQRMAQIIQCVGQNISHVKPLTTTEVVSFPFKIVESTEKSTVLNTLLEILKTES